MARSAVSVVASSSEGAAWIEAVPFAAVSGDASAVLFAVLFGVSGLIQRTVTRRNRIG